MQGEYPDEPSSQPSDALYLKGRHSHREMDERFHTLHAHDKCCLYCESKAHGERMNLLLTEFKYKASSGHRTDEGPAGEKINLTVFLESKRKF